MDGRMRYRGERSTLGLYQIVRFLLRRIVFGERRRHSEKLLRQSPCEAFTFIICHGRALA